VTFSLVQSGQLSKGSNMSRIHLLQESYQQALCLDGLAPPLLQQRKAQNSSFIPGGQAMGLPVPVYSLAIIACRLVCATDVAARLMAAWGQLPSVVKLPQRFFWAPIM